MPTAVPRLPPGGQVSSTDAALFSPKGAIPRTPSQDRAAFLARGTTGVAEELADFGTSFLGHEISFAVEDDKPATRMVHASTCLHAHGREYMGMPFTPYFFESASFSDLFSNGIACHGISP